MEALTDVQPVMLQTHLVIVPALLSRGVWWWPCSLPALLSVTLARLSRMQVLHTRGSWCCAWEACAAARGLGDTGCVCSQMSQPFTSPGLLLARRQQEQLGVLVDPGCWDRAVTWGKDGPLQLA